MRSFLTACEEIENTVARIYHELSLCPAFDAQLRSIWVKMAREEEEHAMQFTFALRLGAARIIEGSRLPRERIRELLERARSLLESVRSVPLSEEEVIRISLHLEQDFLDVHISASAVFHEPDMHEMFKRLAKGDEAHVTALKQYLNRNSRIDYQPPGG